MSDDPRAIPLLQSEASTLTPGVYSEIYLAVVRNNPALGLLVVRNSNINIPNASGSSALA